MADIIINPDNSRISKLRIYLFTILDDLLSDKNYQVNANFLSNDINNYSIDRIPVEKDPTENWIIPIKKYREVYEFRSRNRYSQDVMENLKNIGFFEVLEDTVYSNSKKGILPEIEGIESIECLNCGSLNIANSQTAMFSIQIQINYIKDLKEKDISL